MEKLQAIANFFLLIDDLDHVGDGDGISNLKLQKLVYYAQGFNLALFDEALFKQDIAAWTLGPVVPTLYAIYKVCGTNAIPPPSDNDSFTLLTDDEKELLDDVYDTFGKFTTVYLRKMAQEEPPWIEHESDVSVISRQELSDYFKTRVQSE